MFAPQLVDDLSPVDLLRNRIPGRNEAPLKHLFITKQFVEPVSNLTKRDNRRPGCSIVNGTDNVFWKDYCEISGCSSFYVL